MVHEMKLLEQYFDDVVNGDKPFELRKDDRNIQVDDEIILKEWNGEHYTGRWAKANVTYVLRDCPQYGLMDGYCIIGIQIEI